MIWTRNVPDQPALITLDVSEKIGAENVIVLDDIARMLIIQFTIQLMQFLSDPVAYALFSAEYFLVSMYIVLGVALYWLVFRNLIKFT